MKKHVIPPSQDLVIHFAHVAYRLAERFSLRETGIEHFQTWSPESTRKEIGKGHIIVLSGLWRDDMLPLCTNRPFIQVCAAGYNQFDLTAIRDSGIRLANCSGVNKNAVSEHAMALMLSFTRLLHTTRDYQKLHEWRGLISQIDQREDELGGKTLLILGLGAIGSRLASLSKAFGMHVIGIKRDATQHNHVSDEVYSNKELLQHLPRADFVVLTCPLTNETTNIINNDTLSAMSPTSYLINVARGGCVDQTALVRALKTNRIAGAGIDTTVNEPLDRESSLWDLENVIITPHTAGETRCYEDNVIDILLQNVHRLWSGREDLVNQII